MLADFLHRKAADGDVVRVAPQRFLARELLAQLAALATAMVDEAPDTGFVAATFRDRSGVNRTVAIEILEMLDRLGITQRVGDARKIRKDFVPILGPRAPCRAQPRPRASGTPRAPRAPITLNLWPPQQHDVIVIGAGITGLTASKRLLEAGASVANVEGGLFGGLVTNVNELDGPYKGRAPTWRPR